MIIVLSNFPFSKLTMNDSEQKMVNNLKELLSDISTEEYTDFDYLRWLQGFDYNVDTVVPILRQHFLFLRLYNFGNFDKISEVMENYWPFGLIKLTGKEHYFPNIETYGKLDGEGILKSVSKVDIMLHRMYTCEKVLKVLRKHESETGHQSGLIYIVDLEGAHMTAKKLSLMSGPFKSLINFLCIHYVEMIRSLIVVNTPTIVWALYSIIKPALPEKTRQKLIVLGSNWKVDILQYCDPDILPVHYGGNLMGKNNDPKCESEIVYTQNVPERLYWSPSDDDPTHEDLTVLTVNPGIALYVTVEVRKQDSFLSWYYCTDGDWGFCIYFTDDKNDLKTENAEQVYPRMERVNGPTIVPEKGKIKCKKCGFYKIWFSNTFSWFTKLKVNYKIDITV